MARDLKLVQRGVNVQANDLAVPPGTPVRAINVDYQRDGVAQRRAGFENFYTGLPPYPIDPTYPIDPDFAKIPLNSRVFELLARDRVFMISGGFPFVYDDARAAWLAVPQNMPHRVTFFGDEHVTNTAAVAAQYCGLGRAVSVGFVTDGDGAAYNSTPLRWQSETISGLVGTVGNSTSQASVSSPCRFYRPFDVAGGAVSDYNSIRLATSGSLIAGSLTVTGTANGTGAAATFLNASWMTFDGTDYYVVDNSNQIRKVTQAGVVTTFVGSITAGNTNAVGTSARFSSICGICYDNDALYVLEYGNQQIRRVDVTTANVTTFCTPDDGVAQNGGIEAIGGNLYFASESGISRALLSSGADELYAENGYSSAGMVGGFRLALGTTGCAFTGSAYRLRGKLTPPVLAAAGSFDKSFLIIETTTSDGASVDTGVMWAEDEASTDVCLHHLFRSPAAYPDGNANNKVDTTGPAQFANCDARMCDLGAGVVSTTSQRPVVIDRFGAPNYDDILPRFRALGVMQPEAPVVSSVAGTTFAASTAVAYRVVVGLTLTDGRIALGPPSERIILSGSVTATWAGSITAYPPPGLPYDGMPFLQVYRTRAVANTLDPGDQMFLCYEAALAYDATTVVADALPDDLLGAELYTNATADGVASAALPPPSFVGDVAAFDGSAVLGNLIDAATCRFKVLGTSPLVASTSTLTIDINTDNPNFIHAALVLTAIAGTTDPAAKQFQIASGGTATQNAVQTARNIVRVINRSPDCQWLFAQYDESDPGSVIVTSLWPGLSKRITPRVFDSLNEDQAVVDSQGSISASTNTAAAFAFLSNNVSQRSAAALRWSDVGAFDSFPVGNETAIGNTGEAIVRLLPISDTLLAVKDDAVWRMDSQFDPTIYDAALSCVLPNSFARVNNQWIGLFTRGFVSLGASQAVAIGRPIDRDVTGQYGNWSDYYNETGADFAFAAAIDLSGNYLCSFNRRAYCYNVVAGAWSEWAVCSFVSYDALPVFESGIIGVGAYRDGFIVTNTFARGVLLQRRWQRDATSFYRDFSDQLYDFGTGTLAADLTTITISAYDSALNSGTLPPQTWSPPAGAEAGDGINAAESLWVIEIEQNPGSGAYTAALGSVSVANPGSVSSAITITLLQPVDMVAGSRAIRAYPPITLAITYAPFSDIGSNAGFGDALVTVDRCQPSWLVARFFGRQDYGDATGAPVGDYANALGVSRALLMQSITSAADGLTSRVAYNDAQRFAVPATRANGQTLGLQLWESTAWQPFAIKAVTVNKRTKDNEKVTT